MILNVGEGMNGKGKKNPCFAMTFAITSSKSYWTFVAWIKAEC